MCRLERPANVQGSYGKTVASGEMKPGLIQVLRSCYLDRFVRDTRDGIPVKKAVWFFRKEEDIADVNDYNV